MPIDGSAMYCCPADRSRTASTPSMPGFFVTKSIHWNGPLRIQGLAELAPPSRPGRMTRPVDARAPYGVGPTCSGFRRIRPLNLASPYGFLPFLLRNLLAALPPIHHRRGHGRATCLDSRPV